MYKNKIMEKWKDIPKYEGHYEVSDYGRVKSNKKKHSAILKQTANRKGYLCVGLYKGGKQKTFRVHQLVAMAFLGHVPNGMNTVCDHINNDRANNMLGNLQLISNRRNTSKDRSNGSSKYLGVSWSSKANKWQAQIRIDGKQVPLGVYSHEIDAHTAYQNALNGVAMNINQTNNKVENQSRKDRLAAEAKEYKMRRTKAGEPVKKPLTYLKYKEYKGDLFHTRRTAKYHNAMVLDEIEERKVPNEAYD